MKKKSILFICTGNACRSQMAEGFARQLFCENWKVHSAGTMAAGVHPLTIETMKEAGIDISRQYSKTIDEVPLEEIDFVVTLCENAQRECPSFPAAVTKEHWPIEDPLMAISRSGKINARQEFRLVRDEIRRRVEELSRRLKG